MNYYNIIAFVFLTVVISCLVLKKPGNLFTISLVGDVMLGRLVNEVIKQTSSNYVWGDMLSDLKASDLVIANLETTLTDHTQAVPKMFNFRADPAVVAVLKSGTIGVVNLANNHSLDFGIVGLEQTLDVLDAANIAHVGAGRTISQAQAPVIITRESIKIGVLGYTDNEPDWLATDNKPGTNYISVEGAHDVILNAVSSLKKSVDVCIITLHWGPNMLAYPKPEHVALAHKLIDAGADIVHGHSSHVFQGIERYKKGIILYDTGDFVDDYAVDPVLHNDVSFLFSVQLHDAKLYRLILTPVYINNMQVNRARDNKAHFITNLMVERSKPFGTHFKHEHGKLVLDL